MISARRLARIIALSASVLAVGLMGFTAWATAPLPYAPPVSLPNAGLILRAPFASRIVIGDSRVEWGEPVGEALFAGFGGATIRQAERIAGVFCTLSDAPVTIALGVNDTKPFELDVEASVASLESIIARCEPAPVHLVQIWPVDPQTEPAGRDYDVSAIGQLNAAMLELGKAEGVTVVPAPQLAGHTLDGVHFTRPVSERYMTLLGEPD